jgi:hypothetical protein
MNSSVQKVILTLFCLIAIAAVPTGCGGSDGEGDSEGRGSNTLRVNAAIDAVNRSPNAVTSSGFDTQVQVEVRKGGSAVSGAVVVVETDLGTINLSEGNSGEYRGSQSGYARVFRLTVDAGDDYLRGVRLTGPAIHVFEEPSQGGAQSAETPMLVRWSPSGADHAEMSVAEMDVTVISDRGEYTVLGQHLQADDGDVEEEVIELWRTDVLTPAGTTTGSEVRVIVRNTLDIFVVGPGIE